MGIVGHGFVGKATDWGFNKRVSKFIVDPLHNTSTSDLKDFAPDIVLSVFQHHDDDGNQSSIIDEIIKVDAPLP